MRKAFITTIAPLTCAALLLSACGSSDEEKPAEDVKQVNDSGGVLKKKDHQPTPDRDADGSVTGWDGDHFHAPTPYQRDGLGDNEAIGTPILKLLEGDRQVATVKPELYQGYATGQTDNPRFGWTPEQWSNIVFGTYEKLDKRIQQNTRIEPFQAFWDGQITSGGGLVDMQFVGDPDDVKQLQFMQRDAKPLKWEDKEFQEAYAIFQDWGNIRNPESLDEFKTKYRPRIVTNNSWYSIPGDYATTVVDDSYQPFKEFQSIENVRLNHNYMTGEIHLKTGATIPFHLTKEDNRWKVINLN